MGYPQVEAVGLRRYTLTMIGLTFTGLGAVLYSVLDLSLLQNIQTLESAQSDLLAAQAYTNLQHQIAELDRLADDWTAWEAAYQFGQDRNPNFIADNLNAETLARNDLAWVVYLDPAAELIYGTALDASGQPMVVAPALLAALQAMPLSRHTTLTSAYAGVWAWQDRYALVASRPLRQNDGGGSLPGTAIYGRWLDDLTAIEQQVVAPQLLSLSLLPIATLAERLGRQPEQTVGGTVVSPEARLSYHLLEDVGGEPLGAIVVQSERYLSQQQHIFRRYLLVTIGVLVVAGSSVVVWVIDRHILRRIRCIRQAFVRIAHDQPIDLRVGGQDELSELSETLHEVMCAWQHLQKQNLEAERRYRTVIERAQEAIFLVDADSGQVIQANPAFLHLLGYAAVDDIGLRDFIICDDVIGVCDELRAFLPLTLERPVEQRYRTVQHQMIDVEVSARPMAYGDREVICIVAHDITERKQAERQLRRQAFFDDLTGLPNRRYLMQYLEDRLTHGAVISILFIDIDDFDIVNDSLSHSAGDCLLAAIAQHLEGAMTAGWLLARFGGDEFVIALPGIQDTAQAVAIAERFLSATHQPVLLPGQSIPLWATISIGIAPYQAGLSVETLLRNADKAMYQAKALGRGHCALFTPVTHEESADRLRLGLELRQALLSNELCLHFQPLMAVSTGEISGFEALVRWQHPRLGLLMPNQFLPIAQALGIMAQVDAWVLDRTLMELANWKRLGLATIVVSVNLSGIQLVQPKFYEYICNSLKHHDIEPHQLKFEIVENWLHETNTVLLNTLRSLRSLGVRLGIDDFGTGYSSLSRLHNLPIDTLKIDRAFLQQLSPNTLPSQTLIATIISLAHSLNLDVVAEGVETAWQLRLLQSLGCDHVQGYYVSRPVSASAVLDICRQTPLQLCAD